MTVVAAPLRAVAAFADRIGAYCWLGPTPPGDAHVRARTIASHLGYPRTRQIGADCDPVARLILLDQSEAAHILAVAAGSLAYDGYRPDPAIQAVAAAALAPLGNTATFLSNGFWDDRRTIEWIPLSAATFDAGVIGWNATHAFILWVEDEDEPMPKLHLPRQEDAAVPALR